MDQTPYVGKEDICIRGLYLLNFKEKNGNKYVQSTGKWEELMLISAWSVENKTDSLTQKHCII